MGYHMELIGKCVIKTVGLEKRGDRLDVFLSMVYG